ncbi:unnamed protein product [Lactuca virosa]|uniref:Uncharacterized protein n=1 Tax=Lactuca virosa TaxID=75947 RepID=A0AAU9LTV8_9ASTR|nr:unnamed protein product [Lactuca virosa]
MRYIEESYLGCGFNTKNGKKVVTSSVVGLMRYCFVLLDNKLGAIHSGDYGPGKSIRRDCGHGNPFGKLWSQGQSSFIQWARYIR